MSFNNNNNNKKNGWRKKYRKIQECYYEIGELYEKNME